MPVSSTNRCSAITFQPQQKTNEPNQPSVLIVLSHGRGKRNDRADRLASKATLTSSLLFIRSKVLRNLRHYLRAQRLGHHTTDRLEESGVERGSARRSSLKGRERNIVNQTNIGTVSKSKATLGKLLTDGEERIIMGISERIDTILS